MHAEPTSCEVGSVFSIAMFFAAGFLPSNGGLAVDYSQRVRHCHVRFKNDLKISRHSELGRQSPRTPLGADARFTFIVVSQARPRGKNP